MSDPKHLYKFRHFAENGLHLRILSEDEFFFSSPSRFNDPFDCRIPIRYDDGTRVEVISYWFRYLENQFPDTLPAVRQRIAEDIFDSGRFLTTEGLKTAKQMTEQFGQKRMGIFSLSPHYRNILMWSHYSISHTGFAIGFLIQDIRNLCMTHTATTHQIMVLQQVQYTSQYPNLNAYRHSKRERMEGQLLTKASDWLYEGEYRILLQDGADNVIKIPYDLVSRVILGCQVSDTNKQQMIDILRSRRDKPVLYQAIKADQSFSLNFKRIIY